MLSNEGEGDGLLTLQQCNVVNVYLYAKLHEQFFVYSGVNIVMHDTHFPLWNFYQGGNKFWRKNRGLFNDIQVRF